MTNCNLCNGKQLIAEYVYPNGINIFAKYKCQVCGQGEQEKLEQLNIPMLKAVKS